MFRHWPVIVLLPVAALFFVGGPTGFSLPWVQYGWNLGHIAFFFVAALACHCYVPFRSALRVFLFITAVAMASVAIEFIQSGVGRSLSAMDVARNLTGATLGLAAVAWRNVPKWLVVCALFFGLADSVGFARAALADYTIQTQAPLIDDFQSSLTLGHWHGDTQHIDIPNSLDGQGKKNALQVTFSKNAQQKLEYYPLMRNWQGYELFTMRIFNPASEPIEINLRLNDKFHDLGEQEHPDRFNTSIVLNTGWNTIEIPITTIKTAPQNRDMNMADMRRLILHKQVTDQSIEFVIDDVRLK